MRRQRALRFGALVVGAMGLLAVAGPWLIPFDPAVQQLPIRLASPTWRHPFGLDELGRDVLARVAAGARISFIVGLTVVTVSAAVGTLLGAVAGYAGGRLDSLISRAIDVLLAFPGILLSIALVAVLGPSLPHVVLALVIGGWVGYARLARGQALKLRELEFVQAARALGATPWRVLAGHVIPCILPALTVQTTLGMAGAIIAEASLSFLGLGVQPPTPS